ncbi:MAG: CYTH domain-containing protein [Prolixibacteraceae bacterium]|jgi:adenylate cyclase|nr:CYTH domain-containing protein [Prolixibacteraceae bacterium]
MAKEIERKFLVNNKMWSCSGEIIPMEQAYLSYSNGNVVRVRIAGESAFITIKGNLLGITRDEFEYSIPLSDARQMMKMAQGYRVVKKRHIEYVHGKKWEIDVFENENDGLVVAEIELTEENESFEKPIWILDEVSDDPRYFNFNLAQNPYSDWQ